MKTWAPPTGLLAISMAFTAIPAQAGTFDAALASCAKAAEFCNELSYDKDLCAKTQDGIQDCDEDTGTGVLCRLKLKDIAPTQVSVGAHATRCKAKAKFDRDEKKIRKYLLKSTHHVPTVIGPANGAGKRFYITDHHHLSHALMVANEEKYTDVDALYACILTNRKQDETDGFWSFMVHNHLTWLDDENGKAITPGDLEKRAPDLKDLQNDAYRTWSRWVRDSCGYVKAGNDCVPPATRRTRPISWSSCGPTIWNRTCRVTKRSTSCRTKRSPSYSNRPSPSLRNPRPTWRICRAIATAR